MPSVITKAARRRLERMIEVLIDDAAQGNTWSPDHYVAYIEGVVEKGLLKKVKRA